MYRKHSSPPGATEQGCYWIFRNAATRLPFHVLILFQSCVRKISQLPAFIMRIQKSLIHVSSPGTTACDNHKNCNMNHSEVLEHVHGRWDLCLRHEQVRQSGPRTGLVSSWEGSSLELAAEGLEMARQCIQFRNIHGSGNSSKFAELNRPHSY